MAIPLRRDSEYGLTPAQFAAMPDRLRKKVASLKASEDEGDRSDAADYERDIAVWEQAAKEVAGRGGKWSIVWSDVGKEEAEPVKEADPLLVAIEEYGKRNSAADQSRIQQAHDTLCSLGAKCGGMKADGPAEEAMEAVEEAWTAAGDPAAVTFRESGVGGVTVTFREAGAVFNDADRTVVITPIKPGFGNQRDGFFYPVSSVREAVDAGRFNGVLMFANHPRKSDEKELPERSVRDWVGVIKETTWDEGRQVPRSVLKVLDPDVYERFKAAPEHIAFSVLGQGVARPGSVGGRSARIVESVKAVKSVDWVTKAGAGGAIDFAESDNDEEFEMDVRKMTVAQLREARPDLIVVLREEDEAPPPAAETPEAEGAEAEDEAPEASAEPASTPAPDGYVSREEYDALRAQVDAMGVRESVAVGRTIARQVVEETLSESGLPKTARDFVASRFAEAAVGDGMLFPDAESLKELVEQEVADLRPVVSRRTSGALVKGLGTESEPESGRSILSLKESALTERLDRGDAIPIREGESGTPAGRPASTTAAAAVESRMGRI